ncbi:unnamed protein product [Effrenium voratum]|uniref:Amino acid transporter transmembrane domain-containing protein n=3 Tax=Effrenium voratum TaxID=2562239 RepID=A0AA36JEI9_9DINO|nr:unnamed protein product [Effrenium voratum]CAJ1449610.1 unnamed protein product [Effrenium voratum]
MAPIDSGHGVTDRSPFECMMLLLASGIGSGVLVLPRAMAAVGWEVMLGCLIIAFVISGTTTYILALGVLEVRRRWMEEDLRKPLHPERHMAHTSWLDVANEPVSPSSSPHIHRSSSWRDMAEPEPKRIGPSYADLLEAASPECPETIATLMDVVLLCHNQLALVVYHLFVAQSLEPFLNHRICIILGTGSLGCYLSTSPTVTSLSRLANISPFVLVFLMCAIAGDYVWNGAGRDVDIAAVHDLEKAPAAICISVFAFFWHTNCVAVVRELRHPTPPRLCALAYGSAFTLGLLYFLLALAGYASWGPQLLRVPTILSMYSLSSLAFDVARVLLAISLAIAIPLNVYPIRESVQNLLERFLWKRRRLTFLQPYCQHKTLGCLLVMIPMFTSIFFDNVVQVITIIGGSLVSLMMIPFPSLVFRLAFPNYPLIWRVLFICSILLTTFLASASVGCFGKPV